MPSATHVLRDRIERRFGSIDTHGPEDFLKKRGYTITPGGIIHPPPGEEVIGSEEDCIDFLVFEWDYGFDPKPLPPPPRPAR